MSNFIWNFPMCNHGQKSGFNGTGIDSFLDNPHKYLIREVLQNSLDARKDKKKVKVVVSAEMMNTCDIPGRDSLKQKIIEWFNQVNKVDSSDNKEKNFVKYAKNFISNEKLCYLRISDYNTTGMRGSANYNDESTPFFAFAKGSGINNKGPLAAGSKGLGKNSIFAESRLHSIIISSYADTEEKGTLGIAKFPSINSADDYTQGTGYCVEDDDVAKQYNKAFNELTYFSDSYRREEGDYGSDIYALGFDKNDEWDKKMANEAILSFMPAFLYDYLELEINSGDIIKSINKDSIARLVDNDDIVYEKNSNRYIKALYEVLTSDKTLVFKYPDLDENPGFDMTLYVLKNPENFANKLFCYRDPIKMLIKTRNQQSNFNYTAILIVEGDEICKRLKSVEDVKHTNWSKAAYAESGYTKEEIAKAVDALNQFCDKIFAELNQEGTSGESDLKWAVEQNWTLDEEADAKGKDSGLAIKKITLNTIMPKKKKKSKKPKKQQVMDSSNGLDGFEVVKGSEGGEDAGTIIDHHGGKPGPHDITFDDKRVNLDEGDRNVLIRKKIRTIKSQMISINPSEGLMRLKVIPEESASSCLLYLFKLGRGENVKEATKLIAVKHNNSDVKFLENTIELGAVNSREEIVLDIKTKETRNYIWEVVLDGIK